MEICAPSFPLTGLYLDVWGFSLNIWHFISAETSLPLCAAGSLRVSLIFFPSCALTFAERIKPNENNFKNTFINRFLL